jgi:hypothetical protein
MAQYIRSAKGEMVDFELLRIKAQLASAPVPKAVQARKVAIDIKDGVKTEKLDPEFLAVAEEAAAESSGKAKQLSRK